MELPKRPDFNEYEPRIYAEWEKKQVFTPQIDPDKKPFTILLPPPNANDPLHVGHAMYVIEDILCRYHRMLGDPTLFLPGTDHAGIETQYVFEKHLAKKGQSRFDFDRDTLYQKISEFVDENRDIAMDQSRKLGFGMDWSREKFTLDPEILAIVFETFRKLHSDKLIYRDERLVNYCTHCGTAFSNLEIDYTNKDDRLYYLDYQTIHIATTRPETIFADVAVAVNPFDPNHPDYKEKVGKTATIPITNKPIPIIADEMVDPNFGTGALKITPAHDPTDFQISERHPDLNLPKISVINRQGQLINSPKEFNGLSVNIARKAVVAKLKELGLLVKEEPLLHSVAVCYRCKHTIEPLLTPQWYVKIKTLVDPVIAAIKLHRVEISPLRFFGQLIRWLETAPDWNISRQIVWGPRIPAWYCLDCNPKIELTLLDKNHNSVTGIYDKLKENYDFDQIAAGLQNLIAPVYARFQLADGKCEQCSGQHLLQETDTFDTWFSSGQWPLTTLGYPDGADFKYFYPTSVLDTMWDILAFWVMRMLIFGLYRTDEVPFKHVHLHARVVDTQGRKMSKSIGNVVNPMEVVEKYGADSLRLALVFGVAPAADVALGEEKLVGMRNFVTKLWNISRFVLAQNKNATASQTGAKLHVTDVKLKENQKLIANLDRLTKDVTGSLENFQFSQATEKLYDFTWNEFASQYLEEFKNRRDDQESLLTLNFALLTILKLLHPFIPFVTEEIYQKLPFKDAEFLALAPWPKLTTE